MKQAVDAFEDFLRQRGLSVTSARLRIVESVYSFDERHFDMEQLEQRLRDEGLPFHRTSLFRVIKLLLEAGLLEKIRTNAHRKVAFECTMGQHHHDHLVCNHCGSIVEFFDEEIEGLQKNIAERHGFSLLYHSLILTGICATCRPIVDPERR